MISIQNQRQIIFRRNVINIIQYYILLRIYFVFLKEESFQFSGFAETSDLCSLQYTHDSCDILTTVTQKCYEMIPCIHFSCCFFSFLFINATYNDWISQLS